MKSNVKINLSLLLAIIITVTATVYKYHQLPTNRKAEKQKQLKEALKSLFKRIRLTRQEKQKICSSLENFKIE